MWGRKYLFKKPRGSVSPNLFSAFIQSTDSISGWNRQLLWLGYYICLSSQFKHLLYARYQPAPAAASALASRSREGREIFWAVLMTRALTLSQHNGERIQGVVVPDPPWAVWSGRRDSLFLKEVFLEDQERANVRGRNKGEKRELSRSPEDLEHTP